MKTSDNSTVIAQLEQERARGRQIVFTNGCFDILHVGHVRYLTEARALGDLLVVGLNSDGSVRRLKGEARPIIGQEERAEMLLALKPVDYVAIFEEDTPLELIKQVRPNILVKGGDWPVESIVGNDLVAAYGGRTLSLPYVAGRSSTNVIEKILEVYHGSK